MYVLNTGTQAETITVQVLRLSNGTGRVVPPSWVRATGPGVQLAPGQSTRMQLELAVPGGAQAGPYLSDVVVSGSAGTSAGRTNFGVAAATKLEFSVAPGSPPGLWPFGPSWMWWTAIWLLVLAPLIIAVRRSGIRIRIERTPPGVAHATSRRYAMRRGGPRIAIALLAVTGLAACASPPPTTAGTPGVGSGIAIGLNVIPTLVKVSVSPSSASFTNCNGGNASLNTASTPDALGFPNGHCWLGSNGNLPITITNTGVAADVYVSGANAVPSGGGTQWSLCNLGSSPAVACNGTDGEPGTNQYVAQNFISGLINPAGLTNSMKCDALFAGDQCQAGQGVSQTEGIMLTGPTSTSNYSTSWTITITWTAVSLG